MLQTAMFLVLWFAVPLAAFGLAKRLNLHRAAAMAFACAFVLLLSAAWLGHQAAMPKPIGSLPYHDTYYVVAPTRWLSTMALCYLTAALLFWLVARLTDRWPRHLTIVAFWLFHLSVALTSRRLIFILVPAYRQYSDSAEASALLSNAAAIGALIGWLAAPLTITCLAAAILQRLSRRSK